MYAVNVADLTKYPIVAQFLLAPVIEPREIVQAERERFDGAAIVLQCENERAAAIVATIRLKARKHELRCYVGKSKTWKRV